MYLFVHFVVNEKHFAVSLLVQSQYCSYESSLVAAVNEKRRVQNNHTFAVAQRSDAFLRVCVNIGQTLAFFCKRVGNPNVSKKCWL
jgi:hypothetical protein